MGIDLTGPGPEVGLVVRDPTVMLAFYQSFLGLELEREAEFPGVRLWWLRCGGGHLKLVKLDESPPDSNSPGGMYTATGWRYVTFVVSDVEEFARGVEAAGGTLAFEATMPELTMAMLADPEGNHVELVRWAVPQGG